MKDRQGFIKNILVEIIAALVVILLLSPLVNSLLKPFAVNPERILYAVILVIAIIFFFIIRILSRRKFSSRLWLGFGLICIVLVLITFLIARLDLWCESPPIVLEYESIRADERFFVQQNQILVEPHGTITLFARPFEENNIPDRFNCDWEYQGDGSASEGGCQLSIESGNDDVPDRVTVKMSQPGCRLCRVESVILVPNAEQIEVEDG